jgi:hypothetical protein
MRRGGGMEGLKLSQGINDIVTGITIRYNISSPRDASSGMATGRRMSTRGNIAEVVSSRDAASGLATGRRMSTVGNNAEVVTPRDASSGLATGRRLYGPGQPHYGNISMAPEGENCGPVTKKITHADGSSEEMTFSCPADAAAFERQTPKRDFGDKMSGSTPHWSSFENGNAGEGTGTISGRLHWVNGSALGIVTNKTVENTNGAQRGRQTPNTSFGSIVRLSARDAGSGIATGKRSRDAGSGMATGKRSRDAGSGMATGRRQHQPFYSDGSVDNCNNCPAVVNASQATVNPLYNDNGHSGVNPLHTGSNRLAAGDDDCDGVVNADIMLVDALSGFVIAKTKTEPCGEFFFSNVPSGNYLVRVSHMLPVRKSYDINVTSSSELLGEVIENNSPEIQLELSSIPGDNFSMEESGMAEGQKIKTKSNIKNDRIAAPAGMNGDAIAEGQKIKTKSNIKNDRIAAGSNDENETGGSVVRLMKLSITGRNASGKNVVSPFVPVPASMSPGDPIPGLDVKLGKNNGGALLTTETNEYGEFEFSKLETGDYTLEIEQQAILFNEIEVVLESQTKSQDHNSSRSNKTASTKAQDHNSSRSNKTASTKAQDHNSSRSNKTSSSIAPDPDNGNSDNENSPTKVETIKSIMITADMDGDGVYETNVSNKFNDELTVDSEGNPGGPQQKAGISTSRSNIRTRGQLIDKGDDIYMSYSTAMIDSKTVAVQIIYKPSHDLIKNAIQNLK